MAQNGLPLHRLTVFTNEYKLMKEAQKSKDEVNSKVKTRDKPAVHDDKIRADTAFKQAESVVIESARKLKEFTVIPFKTSEDLEMLLHLKKEFSFGGDLRALGEEAKSLVAEAESLGFVVHL